MTNVVSSVGTIGKSFLSTLSLRRATNWSGVPLVGRSHFYPRSPCGERLVHLTQAASPGGISIHAHLAESDGIQAETAVFVPPISIHALLAESDRGAYRGARQSRPISIHALLAESDKNTSIAGRITEISIHALLAESDNQCKIDQKRSSNFYPRSPCGERPALFIGMDMEEDISIHALLAESDSALAPKQNPTEHFYPRSPCGERHFDRW